MNFKFYLERGILTPSDLVYTDSFTKTEKIEINGKKVTVFRKENGGDMGVFVKEENRAIYAELDNDYDNPITTQTFVNTLIAFVEQDRGRFYVLFSKVLKSL